MFALSGACETSGIVEEISFCNSGRLGKSGAAGVFDPDGAITGSDDPKLYRKSSATPEIHNIIL